jgi:hypothetical protein
MARGGRKTPPPPNRSPIVTRSHSNDNIIPQTATTSNDDLRITVEPVTPNPIGGDVQEIVRQSLLRTHSAFAHLRQPNRPLDQPLDFSDIREQLGGTNLTLNPTDPILTPAAGGSGIPPSPPPSSPSSSGEDSSDEGSSSSPAFHTAHTNGQPEQSCQTLARPRCSSRTRASASLTQTSGEVAPQV